MGLAKFPEAFDITETKKGFFPYFFIKEENFDYSGPLPPEKDFNPEMMKGKKKAEFDLWYADASRRVFNFKK
jgi:hypothetical protein